MTVYIDKDFKCYTTNTDGLTAVEASEIDIFNNKCKEFIEGYRYVPIGETWTREDGIEFHGEMVAPFIDYNELEKAQLIYEKEQAEEIAKILLGENE